MFERSEIAVLLSHPSRVLLQMQQKHCWEREQLSAKLFLRIALEVVYQAQGNTEHCFGGMLG
jgi:hypothetical protein